MLNFQFSIQIILSLSLFAFAQENTSHKPNIAVIDFTGDQTVSLEQLSFISGTLALELVNTKQFVVLDRNRMEFILKEQGFQQSGACNSQECRVQVGQLLGVDDLVSGTLVKFGPSYMMRLDYLDVLTGQIIQSVNIQREGDLYKIVNDMCHEGGLKLVDALRTKHNEEKKPQEPSVNLTVTQINSITPAKLFPIKVPHNKTQEQTIVVSAGALPKVQPSQASKTISLKRKVALFLWGSSLASVGAGYYFNQKGVDYIDDYNEALNSGNHQMFLDASSSANNMKTYRAASYGLSIGSALVGLVLWVLPEGK